MSSSVSPVGIAGRTHTRRLTDHFRPGPCSCLSNVATPWLHPRASLYPYFGPQTGEQGPDKGQSECIKHQWIGVAHAVSLNGPWERPAQPVLTGAPAPSWEGGMVANPGVVVTANGSLLMAYRGLNDRGIGMAVSPRWDQPFTRLNGGAPVLGPSANPPTPVDEDMTMYVCPRARALALSE